jgi:hypothetical protein
MGVTRHRAFHALVALVLFICAVCPFIEIALHLDDCIFLSGHDNESTLAFLLLVVELVFALGTMLVALFPRFLRRLSLAHFDRLTLSAVHFTIVLPEIFPPVPLRI